MNAQPHALQLAFRRAEANVQMHKGRRLLHAAVKSAALPRPRRRPRRLGQQLHGGPRVGVRDDGTGGQNLKAQRPCEVGGCGRRLARAPEAVAGRIVARPPPLGVPSRPEPRRHALRRCRSRARAVPRGSLWALWACCRTSPPRSVTPTARPDSSTLMRSTCVLRRTVPPCRSVPLYAAHQRIDHRATTAHRIVEDRARAVEVAHSKGHRGAQRAWVGLGLASGFEFESGCSELGSGVGPACPRRRGRRAQMRGSRATP